MKTINIFLGIALLILTSCGNQKAAMMELQMQQMQMQMQAQQSQQSSNPRGTKLEIPCKDASLDSDTYFAALGTGSHINEESARTAAWQAATTNFKRRLGGFVQGLSTSYSRSVAGDASGEKVQRLMEDEMNQIVETMVNDAAKVCEEQYYDESGKYRSYIAIQIPKQEMVNKMSNALSDNEELEIEFNRDQFRKYADEKMKAMKEAQAASGN